MGGREERRKGCSLGSQQPQPQASVLDAGGKWSRLAGSVRETAMMMEDNREGKRLKRKESHQCVKRRGVLLGLVDVFIIFLQEQKTP